MGSNIILKLISFTVTALITFSIILIPDYELKVKEIILPVRIEIPSIKVNAEIEIVGLNLDGSIGSPEKPENVAWFNKSPLPGEIGNSIMDGHFGWKNGVQSVFDNLAKIKIGDEIYIENGNEATVVFIVRDIKIYEEDSDTKILFNSIDDKSHLILITCGGLWDKIGKSYSERLVVFADRK